MSLADRGSITTITAINTVPYTRRSKLTDPRERRIIHGRGQTLHAVWQGLKPKRGRCGLL